MHPPQALSGDAASLSGDSASVETFSSEIVKGALPSRHAAADMQTGIPYFLRVTAANSLGFGEYGDNIAVATAAEAPAAPGNLAAGVALHTDEVRRRAAIEVAPAISEGLCNDWSSTGAIGIYTCIPLGVGSQRTASLYLALGSSSSPVKNVLSSKALHTHEVTECRLCAERCAGAFGSVLPWRQHLCVLNDF